MWWLAQAADAVTTTGDLQGHYGNLIFTGCFFIGLIVAGIWWLKRSA